MPQSLSTNLTAGLMAQQTDIIDICLITLTHEKWTTPIYLSTDATTFLRYDSETNAPIYGTKSRGIEFLYVPITINLPSSEDETPPEGTITFSNIARTVTPYLMLVDTKYPKMTLELTSNIAVDIIEITYPELEITSASWDASTVEVKYRMSIASDEPLPWLRFIPAYWFGLFSFGVLDGD